VTQKSLTGQAGLTLTELLIGIGIVALVVGLVWVGLRQASGPTTKIEVPESGEDPR